MEESEYAHELNSKGELVSMIRFGVLVKFATFVVVVGLLADAMLHFVNGNKFLLYKDLLNFSVVPISLLLYFKRLYSLSTHVIIVVYSVYINLFSSLPIRVWLMGDFHFESYFLKTELIFVIFTYTIGVWISARHMFISLLLNAIFMVLCFLFVQSGFTWAQYLFYFIIVVGAGLVSIRLHKELKSLRISLINRSELIEAKNKELEKSNRAKNDLFRIIGHDMRAPLGQIKILVEMLEQTESEESFKESKGFVMSAVEKADSLLKDLMVWARSNDDTPKVNIEEVNLSDLIDEEINQFSLSLKAKQLELDVLVPQNTILETEKRVLATILRNLLSNSIKFTPKGGLIEIGHVETNGYDEVFVRDNGVGMDQDQVSKLFEIDRNKSRKGTDGEEGTGFGLMICKKMAEILGGDLTIDSAVNHGTTVFIRIPKSTN